MPFQSCAVEAKQWAACFANKCSCALQGVFVDENGMVAEGPNMNIGIITHDNEIVVSPVSCCDALRNLYLTMLYMQYASLSILFQLCLLTGMQLSCWDGTKTTPSYVFCLALIWLVCS